MRELENVIERALIYAKERPIGVADLPEYLLRSEPVAEGVSDKVDVSKQSSGFAGMTIKEMEKQMILAALERCTSKVQAARELGISVRKIEYLVKAWQS